MIYRFSKPIFFIIIAVIVVALSGCASTTNNPMLGVSYNCAGVRANNSGDSEKALKYYALSIKANPNYAMVWRNRGILNWKLDRDAEAYADFLKAGQLGHSEIINISGTDYTIAQIAAMAANVVAVNLYDAKQYTEAAQWWEKAIAAYPWPKYFERLGRAYVRLNDNTKAYKALDQWLEHFPRYAPYKNSLGLLIFDDDQRGSVRDNEAHYGSEAAKKGDYLTAFKHFSKSYALTSPSTLQDLFRGSVIRNYQKANPKPELPEEARRYQVKAQAHMTAGRDKKAITAYEKLYQICPWFPEASFNQALVFGKLGEKCKVEKTSSGKEYFSKAVFWMKNYLKLAPDARTARTAQDKIYAWEAAME